MAGSEGFVCKTCPCRSSRHHHEIDGFRGAAPGRVQLVVVGQVNQTKTALAQDSFHPVAADVVGQGLSGNRRGWLPFGLINGLHRIVHTTLLSLAVVTKGSRRQRLYQVRLVFILLPCWGRHGQNTSVAPT